MVSTLGMEIQRNITEGMLSLSQRSYLEKILYNYAITDAKPVTVSMGPWFKHLLVYVQ